MSWRTLLAYFVLSRNGEESFNKFSSPNLVPDPDHLRGGPSHGDITDVEKIKSIGRIVFDRQADRHKPKCITLRLLPGSEDNNGLI